MRTLTALVCAVVLLIVGAVGAYAWDAANADRIADGVTVADLDLGGLTEQEASELLRHELVKPLSKPVVVKHGEERFRLSPAQLDVRADIDGMVAEAIAQSREGWLPERVLRYATGGEVDHSIEPRVAYSETAVERFVDGVAAKVNREPVDATIQPAAASLSLVEAQDGAKLRERRLHAGIERLLDRAGTGPRRLTAKVERVKPAVTKRELAEQYPIYLTVDRGSFTLRVFKDLKLSKEYTIAVGQVGYDTPAGLYHIQNKAVNPTWNVPNSDWAGELAGQVIPGGAPNNPLKARWLGIYNGAGIHGTDAVGSLGSAASHGCIRMAIPDVVELYDQIPVGTPIYIQ